MLELLLILSSFLLPAGVIAGIVGYYLFCTDDKESI